MATTRLQLEDFPQLAPNRALPRGRHTVPRRQDVLASELNHEVTAASRFLFEPIGRVEKNFVRSEWPIGRANGAAHEPVEIEEVGVARQVVRGENDEVMRIRCRRIRHQHDVPLTQSAQARRAIRLRAAAALIALSRAMSSAVSSNLNDFLRRELVGRFAATRRERDFGRATIGMTRDCVACRSKFNPDLLSLQSALTPPHSPPRPAPCQSMVSAQPRPAHPAGLAPRHLGDHRPARRRSG